MYHKTIVSSTYSRCVLPVFYEELVKYFMSVYQLLLLCILIIQSSVLFIAMRILFLSFKVNIK